MIMHVHTSAACKSSWSGCLLHAMPYLALCFILQANAQAALPIAAKYCMQRPIQRYTQHIRHIKVGTLKEAVQWLDLFCHTCKASDPIIAHFAGACSSMVKMGTGLSDAAALITGARSVGVQAPPAGAAIDLHPLAASHILAAAFNAMPHIQRHVFHCSTCSAEQVYWEQKKIQSFGSCAPITLDCNACKGTMHKPCL